MEGLTDYRSLKDGSLDLEDFLRMNDALTVRTENLERRRAKQDGA